MRKKRYASEEVNYKVREVEVLFNQGKVVQDPYNQIGVTGRTHFYWCKEYGGLKVN